MVSEDVDKPYIDLIQRVLDVKPLYFDYIHNPSVHHSRLNNNYSKVRLWQLTSYSKVVYYDSDFLILRDHDDLCHLSSGVAAVENYSSFKDKFTGDFNSGMLAITPSFEVFEELYNYSQTKKTPTGGDQPMLNKFFSSW